MAPKLLLTSAGITNASLRAALVDLLGRPIEECSALCVPTASHGQVGGMGHAWDFVAGLEPRTPMVELGWRSVGLLELNALPSAGEDRWVPQVEAADALLVSGGDTLFVAHWLRESRVLEHCDHLVYVGFSAGSCALGPRLDDRFAHWRGADPLGLVDFEIFPHVDNPEMPPGFAMADAEEWAQTILATGYALDDSSGIVVDGDRVEVVSEGTWRRFSR